MSGASAIYVGRVRHRRFAPKPHAFGYNLFMTYLDLAELESIFDSSWLSSSRRAAPVRFRRADYFGDSEISLDEAVRREVQTQTGHRPSGPIRLLTHLRSFGLSFNPVSFYYCFSDDGQRVETVVAEITNTPWDERYCYVLSKPAERRGPVSTYCLNKEFHVSPFLPMEQDYRWRFSDPGERLLVHMENFQPGKGPAAAARPGPPAAGADRDPIDRGPSPSPCSSAAGAKVFDATLTLRRRATLTPGSLLRQHFRHPAVPVMVLFGIYRQALALWRKKVPFFTHPAKLAPARATAYGADMSSHGALPVGLPAEGPASLGDSIHDPKSNPDLPAEGDRRS